MTITRFPKTAYEVISILSTQELLSQEELDTLLDHRNRKEVRYAVRRLQENHVLQIQPNLLDMRSSTYRISTEQELKQAKRSLSPKVYDKVMSYIYGNKSTHAHPFLQSTV